MVRTLKRLQNWQLTDDDYGYINSAAEGEEIDETPPKKKIQIIDDDDEEDLIGI